VGFGTVFSDYASGATAVAISFMDDISPLVGLVLGVAVLSLLVSVFMRFVR